MTVDKAKKYKEQPAISKKMKKKRIRVGFMDRFPLTVKQDNLVCTWRQLVVIRSENRLSSKSGVEKATHGTETWVYRKHSPLKSFHISNVSQS